MTKHARLATIVVALALLAGACGTDPDPASTTLTIFAASSLTEAFTELGDAFEAEHAGVDVVFNFAASSALVQQVTEGAAADVVVTADEANMDKLIDADAVEDPEVIARNRLAIIVEPGNPKSIEGLEDLADPDAVVVLCAPEVPCGRFAAAALARTGVSLTPASLEENVKAAASRVILGEADAGIVYVTDVQAAGDKAEGVDIDIADDAELEAVYPMAPTTQAANRPAAALWLSFVLSSDGEHTLDRLGFLAP